MTVHSYFLPHALHSWEASFAYCVSTIVVRVRHNCLWIKRLLFCQQSFVTHFISAISTPQPAQKDVLLFVTSLFFLTTSRQQHPLYRTPFSFPLAPVRLLLPRPLPHLPNKDPTRNKALLFKGATASKVSPTFLFSSPSFFFLFPPGSVCAHQPVGLCCPVRLSLDRFMTLCGIC